MATIKLTPSSYELSDSTYLQVSNPSNMYTDVSSTTYGTITHNRASTTAYAIYLRGFNFDDIPEGAIITSFTIKLKARESSLRTTSAYAPGICNGTTVLDGSFGALSTSTKTLECTGVTASFDTIKGYGSNFGIHIPLRRSSTNTSGYVRVYGAEIEVSYTFPVTISFDANGGTGQMADVTTYGAGASYPLPACSFTAPAGRAFDGWLVNGTRYAAGTSITLTGDTTVTALWTYLVSYNANGGTGAMTSSSVSRDDTYVLPACSFTAPAGVDQWRFDHWAIGGTSYDAGDEAEITGDTTAIAHWIRPTIYIKTGSGWAPMDAGYEKESGAWTQKGMSALFQSGRAYRKGTE